MSRRPTGREPPRLEGVAVHVAEDPLVALRWAAGVTLRSQAASAGLLARMTRPP